MSGTRFKGRVARPEKHEGLQDLRRVEGTRRISSAERTDEPSSQTAVLGLALTSFAWVEIPE